MVRLCRTCNFVYQEDLAYCGRCGSPLVPAQMAEQVRTPPPQLAPPRPAGKSSTLNTCGVIVLSLFGILLTLVAISFLFTPSPKNNREGHTLTFQGTVGDPETAFLSGTPYFEVRGGGQTVKCYYNFGSVPRKGAWVQIQGIATVWSDRVGGSLRPCVVIGADR